MPDLDTAITEMIVTLREAKQSAQAEIKQIAEELPDQESLLRKRQAVLELEAQAGALLKMMMGRESGNPEVVEAQDLLEYFQYTGGRLTALIEMGRGRG